MKYQEIVRNSKALKTLMFYVGFPVCILIVLNMWGFNIFGMRENISLGMKLGVTLLLGLVSEEIVRLYLKFNKQLDAMKRAVNANSDADMEQLLAKCHPLGKEAWISEDYILNFDSMLAYSRHAVVGVERSGKPEHQVYGVRLAVSGQPDDWIFFANEPSREQAYAMFYAETQARQNQPYT